MVGTSLNYFDFEDYDPEYFKTLKWMLENDVNMLDLTFSYETNHFGKI
jgi:E3 ubiquitin-protein ligase HUWE1